MMLAIVTLLAGLSGTPGVPVRTTAAVMLDRAMASAPSTPAQWNALAKAFYDARRYREAVASFERVMQLDKAGAPDAAWNVARAYARLGNKKQAIRWLGHARQLGFTNEAAIRREPAFDRYRDEVTDVLSISFRPTTTAASPAIRL